MPGLVPKVPGMKWAYFKLKRGKNDEYKHTGKYTRHFGP